MKDDAQHAAAQWRSAWLERVLVSHLLLRSSDSTSAFRLGSGAGVGEKAPSASPPSPPSRICCSICRAACL